MNIKTHYFFTLLLLTSDAFSSPYSFEHFTHLGTLLHNQEQVVYNQYLETGDNAGDLVLTVSTSDSPAFELYNEATGTGETTLQLTLEPNSRRLVQARFTPSELGNDEATLTIACQFNGQDCSMTIDIGWEVLDEVDYQAQEMSGLIHVGDFSPGINGNTFLQRIEGTSTIAVGSSTSYQQYTVSDDPRLINRLAKGAFSPPLAGNQICSYSSGAISEIIDQADLNIIRNRDLDESTLQDIQIPACVYNQDQFEGTDKTRLRQTSGKPEGTPDNAVFGTLQVFLSPLGMTPERWNNVCEQTDIPNSVVVICRELGFTDSDIPINQWRTGSNLGNNIDFRGTNSRDCAGTEEKLEDCPLAAASVSPDCRGRNYYTGIGCLVRVPALRGCSNTGHPAFWVCDSSLRIIDTSEPASERTAATSINAYEALPNALSWTGLDESHFLQANSSALGLFSTNLNNTELVDVVPVNANDSLVLMTANTQLNRAYVIGQNSHNLVQLDYDSGSVSIDQEYLLPMTGSTLDISLLESKNLLFMLIENGNKIRIYRETNLPEVTTEPPTTQDRTIDETLSTQNSAGQKLTHNTNWLILFLTTTLLTRISGLW